MRCEEALSYWQQELLGQPVDPNKLEEAYAHIGACQELCARILGAVPDFDMLSPEQRSGQTDLYEALGLSAEEEGDAHARQWGRLRRLATAGKASQEAVEHERAMALAAWQSAATHYNNGLRIGKTAFLSEGLKRIKRKRLEPAASFPRRTKTGARLRAPRGASRKTPTRPTSAAPPGESPPDLLQEAWPLLALVSHVPTHQIIVGQRPAGWQISSARSNTRLMLRERPALYPPSMRDIQEPKGFAVLGQPQVDGVLAPFELALWAAEFSQKWEVDVLVRADSPRRPWTSIMLTMEDAEQRLRKPTLMEFARRDSQMTGWWARLKEIDSGAYQLRFSANDARGKSSEDTTLGLSLLTEE